MDRRVFIKSAAAGSAALAAARLVRGAPAPAHPQLHRVHHIPVPDFTVTNRHPGVESLLFSLASGGIRLYRTATEHPLGSRSGLIAADDTVLVKVNAQWKYRGCTNSDVVRGIIQRLLEHPDGFTGEIVIVENGQGRGSLNCDTMAGCDGGTAEVHANAENESHSFTWLVNSLFQDVRVGQRLLDPVRTNVVPAGDHTTEGFRKIGTTSYPCFFTPQGKRVELAEGIWTGSGYDSTHLKWINIPVLKDHKDLNVTASLKHVYGLFTTFNVGYDFHEPTAAGGNMADFYTLVRPPVLNVLDCIWVSHASLCGYPPSTTTRVDMLVGGLDPCAIDAWSARHILLPISGDPAHDPDVPGLFRAYLTSGRDKINAAGGLNGSLLTIDDQDMALTHQDARQVQLMVSRAGANVKLMWAGGLAPYQVERDTDPRFPSPLVLASGLATTEFTDAGAGGNPILYYRIT